MTMSNRYMMLVRVLLTLLCVIFGAYRIYLPVVSAVHREDVFKDLAHLLVGQVCGMALAFSMVWRTVRHLRDLIADYSPGSPAVSAITGAKDSFRELCGYFWILFWAMVVLEVSAFIMHKA